MCASFPISRVKEVLGLGDSLVLAHQQELVNYEFSMDYM